MNLIDDPDIRRYLSQYGELPAEVPGMNPMFRDSPEVLDYAGLPSTDVSYGVDDDFNDFTAAQDERRAELGNPMVPPMPDASELQPSARVQGLDPEVRAALGLQAEAPASLPAPAPRPQMIDAVPRVPESLNRQAEESAQSQFAADEQALNARQEQIRIEREALATRKGEIEAERQAKAEEMARQEATAQGLRKQQTEIAAEKDAPLDPNRYMSNMSAGATLFAAAAAFAYGFMNPHAGKNPINDIISENIDRDIEAQKAQISAGRDNRQNRLGVLKDQLGSTEAAAARLRIEQANLVDKHLDVLEKDTKSQVDRAGLGAARAQAAAQREKGQFDLQKELYAMQEKLKPKGTGDPAKRMKEKIELAQMMQSNGSTPAEILAATGIRDPGNAQTPDQRKSVVTENARVDREGQKADAKEDTDARKSAEKLGVQMKDVIDAKAAYQNLMSVTKLSLDDAGEVSGPSDIPGVGTVDRLANAVTPGGTESGQRFDNAVTTLQQKITKMVSGAAASDKEAARIKSTISSITERNFKEKMRVIGDLIGEHEKTVRGSFSDKATEYYDAGQTRERGVSNPYGGVPHR